MQDQNLGLIESISNAFPEQQFCVPMEQVILFVILISFALFLKRYKLGLFISYLFVFFWGFIFKSMYFLDLYGNSSQSLFVYISFGVLMGTMVLIGFFQDTKASQVIYEKLSLAEKVDLKND